jgi:hypothetical protein
MSSTAARSTSSRDAIAQRQGSSSVCWGRVTSAWQGGRRGLRSICGMNVGAVPNRARRPSTSLMTRRPPPTMLLRPTVSWRDEHVLVDRHHEGLRRDPSERGGEVPARLPRDVAALPHPRHGEQVVRVHDREVRLEELGQEGPPDPEVRRGYDNEPRRTDFREPVLVGGHRTSWSEPPPWRGRRASARRPTARAPRCGAGRRVRRATRRRGR